MINVKLSAVRRLAGVISGVSAAQMTDVPNMPQRGARLEDLLTKEQARELLAVPTARPSKASAIT